MSGFTKYQKDEILALIEIRQDTIDDDPDSADELECIDGALLLLRNKIESNDMNFTELERKWIISEAENRQQVAYDNQSSEGNVVLGLAKSMQNVIDKLQSK